MWLLAKHPYFLILYPGLIQFLQFELFKFQFGLFTQEDKFSFCNLNCSNFNLVYLPQTNSVSAIWLLQFDCSNFNLVYLPRTNSVSAIWIVRISIWFIYPGQIQFLQFELFKFQFGLFTPDKFSFCNLNVSNFNLVYSPRTNSVSAIWIVRI